MSQRKGGIIHDPGICQIGNCKQRRDHANRLHREQPVFEEGGVIIMSDVLSFPLEMKVNRTSAQPGGACSFVPLETVSFCRLECRPVR